MLPPLFENAKSVIQPPNKRGLVVGDLFKARGGVFAAGAVALEVHAIRGISDNHVHAGVRHLPQDGEAVPVDNSAGFNIKHG